MFSPRVHIQGRMPSTGSYFLAAIRPVSEGFQILSSQISIIVTPVLADDCGVCGGNNSTCAGCDGLPNSGLVVDSCGTCNGTDTSCVGPSFVYATESTFCIGQPVRVGWVGRWNHSEDDAVTIQSQSTIIGAVVLPSHSSRGFVDFAHLARRGTLDGVLPSAPGNYSICYQFSDPILPSNCSARMRINSSRVDACGFCDGNNSTCSGTFDSVMIDSLGRLRPRPTKWPRRRCVRRVRRAKLVCWLRRRCP